jgi:hypothetical protein
MPTIPSIIALLIASQVAAFSVDVLPDPTSPPPVQAAAPAGAPPAIQPLKPIAQNWQAPGYLWVPGHYDWDGKAYVWKDGSWQPAKPPAGVSLAWVEGKWTADPAGGDGWLWMPAHFEPITADGLPAQPPPEAQAPGPVAVQQAPPDTTVVVEQAAPAYYDDTVIIGAPIWGPFYGGGYWRGGVYYGGGYYRGGYYGGGYYGGGYYHGGGGYYGGGYYHGGGGYSGGAVYRGSASGHSGPPSALSGGHHER